jgi:hypothetical protein
LEIEEKREVIRNFILKNFEIIHDDIFVRENVVAEFIGIGKVLFGAR